MKFPKCSCVLCKKEISINGINTHYERVHLGLNSKYSSGNNGKYLEIKKQTDIKRNKKISLYNDNPKLCLQCYGKIPYEQRRNKLCSASCRGTYSNNKRIASGWKLSEETRKLISEKIKKVGYRHPPKLFNSSICKSFNCCNFVIKPRKYCTRKCRYAYIINKNNIATLKSYRLRCNFKFNIFDYPDKFDLELVKEHGMYSPKNKNNNLYGVSRDHMISVVWGFKNGIDSEILSHPANCQLLLHSDNVSKGTSCDITYGELLHRINEWAV